MSDELKFEILSPGNFKNERSSANQDQSASFRRDRKKEASGVSQPRRVILARPPADTQVDLAKEFLDWVSNFGPAIVESDKGVVTEFVCRCEGLLTTRFGSQPEASNPLQALIVKRVLFVADIALLADPGRYRDTDTELIPFLNKWGQLRGRSIQTATTVEKRRVAARRDFQFKMILSRIIGNSAHAIPLSSKVFE